MYAFIKGILIECSSSSVVIENSGIGYKVFIPSTYVSKVPEKGSEIFLYLTPIIRENAFSLFGFFTAGERSFFEVLINISGIGPKTALGVVGMFSLRELAEAIRDEDVSTIVKVPGIGKKTAERLIIEVRDKLPSLSDYEEKEEGNCLTGKQTILDAMNALINLGYNHSVAQKAIKKTLTKMNKEKLELPLLITSALQHVN